METLIELDKTLLLLLNGSDSLFTDGLATVLTAASTWIPLYVALFYLVLRNNDNVRQIFLAVGGAALCALLAGSVDDTIIKPLVARWRPTHDPAIGLLVDTVNGYRGGNYGFFSAHAANTFSLAVYFCFIVRSRAFSFTMIGWSLVNCWTRLYLGVHYPCDILCGLVWGGIVGFVLSYIVNRVRRSLEGKQNFISSQYTSTGYLLADIDIVFTVFAFTAVYVLVRACVMAYG